MSDVTRGGCAAASDVVQAVRPDPGFAGLAAAQEGLEGDHRRAAVGTDEGTVRGRSVTCMVSSIVIQRMHLGAIPGGFDLQQFAGACGILAACGVGQQTVVTGHHLCRLLAGPKPGSDAQAIFRSRPSPGRYAPVQWVRHIRCQIVSSTPESTDTGNSRGSISCQSGLPRRATAWLKR